MTINLSEKKHIYIHNVDNEATISTHDVDGSFSVSIHKLKHALSIVDAYTWHGMFIMKQLIKHGIKPKRLLSGELYAKVFQREYTSAKDRYVSCQELDYRSLCNEVTRNHMMLEDRVLYVLAYLELKGIEFDADAYKQSTDALISKYKSSRDIVDKIACNHGVVDMFGSFYYSSASDVVSLCKILGIKCMTDDVFTPSIIKPCEQYSKEANAFARAYRDIVSIHGTIRQNRLDIHVRNNNLTTIYEQYSKTGRIVTHSPNIQGIPNSIRYAKGVIWSYDYCMQEVVILACNANDDILKREIIISGYDIYSNIAKGLDISRSVAKRLMLMMMYGASDDTIMHDTKLEKDKFTQVSTAIRLAFKKSFDYLHYCYSSAAQNRQISLGDGMYVFMEPYNMDFKSASYSYPMQGLGATIMKRAIVSLHEKHPELNIVCPRHDEIIIAYNDMEQALHYYNIVVEIMEKASSLYCSIPIKVKAKLHHEHITTEEDS